MCTFETGIEAFSLRLDLLDVYVYEETKTRQLDTRLSTQRVHEYNLLGWISPNFCLHQRC